MHLVSLLDKSHDTGVYYMSYYYKKSGMSDNEGVVIEM
jgi:hypothetical protein